MIWLAVLGATAVGVALFRWVDRATDAPIMQRDVNAGTARYRARNVFVGGDVSAGGDGGGCDAGGGGDCG